MRSAISQTITYLRLTYLEICDYNNDKQLQTAVLFRLYRILFIKCNYETRQVKSLGNASGILGRSSDGGKILLKR